jgi:hypothetical protein
VRTHYVSDVKLEPHPTAGATAKVLKVKLSNSDGTTVECTQDLYGHETLDQFHWSSKTPPSEKKLLDEVAKSLLDRIGKNGVLDWSIADLQHHIDEFELLWKRKAFSSALRAYGVINRLTLEQATLVLQEHYVVEPIMES